ncbi:MAG: amino acid deaminase/aldolase [Thermoleophilaceae bacterium]
MATAERTVAAGTYEGYEAVFASIDAPFAFVDLDAMWANGLDMLQRAGGKPIRVATKSLRCRPLIASALENESGFRGLMTFTLAETLWLWEMGFEDLLLAYPTTDRQELARLAAIEGPARPAIVIDSVEHLDFVESAAAGGAPIRVCIEIDLSFWTAGGRVKVGTKRSPVRTPDQAVALAREIERRPGFELAGLMGYEGHIAGVGDSPRERVRAEVIRRMRKSSVSDIRERRAAIVEAVSRVKPLEFVNGGGTGSLELTAAEDAVTELAAGSGFYAPTLFDHYSSFKLRPAAMFALPVSRRPAPGWVTLLGGGYLASGPADDYRLPTPHLPIGLELDSMEGGGEVQTPVHGAAANRLKVGDRVYMRHAKAGELCERFDSLYLVEDGRVVDHVPTYRGEGLTFL